jgi:hypothetical protein
MHTKYIFGKLEKGEHTGDSSRWEDNINSYLKRGGCEGMGWINMTQDRAELWSFVKSLVTI